MSYVDKILRAEYHKRYNSDPINKEKNRIRLRINKEYYKKHGESWRKANPDKNAAKSAKYTFAKNKRVPKWLTFEQLEEITYFYSLAKELQWLSEDKLEVDHIIPLQGKDVSGLHVPWNLQILPKSLNIKKGNKI